MADTTTPTSAPLSLQSLLQLMQMLGPTNGGTTDGGEGNGDGRQVDVNRQLVDRDPPASSRALSMVAQQRGRIY